MSRDLEVDLADKIELEEPKKYKVILMSTDKFINPIDSIINGSIYIYDQDYFSNSIVFIDEFDTSKEKILNKIIDDGIKNDTDIFRTFLQIYNSLTSINVPESIVRESKKNYIFEGMS